MTRFLLRRLGLALVTLWLLSVIVFVGAQVLPGNPGRAILGPFADNEAVVALNQELGYDQPLLTRYWDWLSGFLHGDMGTSYVFQLPVSDFIGHALVNSLKLAAVAFVIVVPLSILGGVVAALHVGRPADRAITVSGLSLSTVPEFVTGIVLILVFGIWLGWLPVTATAPAGSGAITQIKYLLLPALALTGVLFGYIARMARAGTVAALDSDYTRTAVLKGLPRRTVVRRHVLRNSLLPTIAVIAVQVGLPHRRPRRDRAALQLQRHRPADLRGRTQEGLPDAPVRRADGRRSSTSSRRSSRTSSTRCSTRASATGRANDDDDRASRA